MSRSQDYKKIKVFYTGGTIGMQKNADGVYAPKPNALKDKIRETPELHNKEEAEKVDKQTYQFEFILKHSLRDCVFLYDVEEYHPLLDSSNMTPDSWMILAKDIKRDYGSFDGFVVIHGTDTIAFTASALSFMLEGLKKPVIMTAAMIPIFELRSDAINNIVCSLILAGCYNIPEVAIFCGNKLLRGNRTTKFSTELMNPFESFNCPPLALMDSKEEVNYEIMCKPKPEAFSVHEELCNDVIILPVYPGIKASTLRQLLQPPVRGAVIQCFGAGNVPSHPEMVQVFTGAVQQEILIVRISQCHKGSISDAYAVGLILAKAGVVSGSDMTTEAAYAKLCWVLGKGDLNFQAKCDLMKTSVRGELTPCSS